MADRKQRGAGGAVARRGRSHAQVWLSAEIELMIREHERLLHAAGAAATLFAALDIRKLPSEARQSLCRLGVTLASLSDETLADAMEQLVERDAVTSAAHS